MELTFRGRAAGGGRLLRLCRARGALLADIAALGAFALQLAVPRHKRHHLLLQLVAELIELVDDGLLLLALVLKIRVLEQEEVRRTQVTMLETPVR